MTAPRRNVPAESGRYEIRLKGRLDPRWRDWFEGFTLTTDGDDITTLMGQVTDQAALHGLLRRVNDLGVALISVNVTPGPSDPTPTDSNERNTPS